VGRLSICAELETALRDSQEKSLLASAAPSPMPSRRSRNACFAIRRRGGFAAAPRDLYVFPLRSQPMLDGYRDDWASRGPDTLPTTTGYGRARRRCYERYLYLYIEVDDPTSTRSPATCVPNATASIESI